MLAGNPNSGTENTLADMADPGTSKMTAGTPNPGTGEMRPLMQDQKEHLHGKAIRGCLELGIDHGTRQQKLWRCWAG